MGLENVAPATNRDQSTPPPAEQPPQPPQVVARARKYLAKIPGAISGSGGHNHTFHTACILVCGFSLDAAQALELMREWNDKCEPPWSDGELEHKITGALKTSGERGYLLQSAPVATVSTSSASPPKSSMIDITSIRGRDDLANSRRLAAAHSDRLCYCIQQKQWYAWDNKRWVPVGLAASACWL